MAFAEYVLSLRCGIQKNNVMGDLFERAKA